MILLAMDTSTERAALALEDEAGGIRVATFDSGRRHGRDLIPCLNGLLDSAEIEPSELGAIAIGLGPGSYTGLRVGVTAAKTLAYATGAVLIGVSSLHAIGRNATPDACHVSVIADAQRGELYIADLIRLSPGAPLIPAAETRVEPLATWVGGLPSGSIVLGPALGSARIRSSIPVDFLPPDEGANHPRGEKLIELAREALSAGRRDDPWLLEPLYLRRSAAEDQWESRHRTSRD
jgi:tRNA threonylcarbamoyladenosine biosynthesis protein TsaB